MDINARNFHFILQNTVHTVLLSFFHRSNQCTPKFLLYKPQGRRAQGSTFFSFRRRASNRDARIHLRSLRGFRPLFRLLLVLKNPFAFVETVSALSFASFPYESKFPYKSSVILLPPSRSLLFLYCRLFLLDLPSFLPHFYSSLPSSRVHPPWQHPRHAVFSLVL